MCVLTCLDNLNTINRVVATFIQSIQTPQLTKIMIFLTDVGSPVNITMMCLVLILVLWLHKKPHHMVQFIAAVLVGITTVSLIKIIVKLPRPAGSLITETGYSFASGHAATATIFFLLIAYAYKSHIRSPFLRRLFIIANCLIAFSIGFSRLYLGVHYATDVIFGFFIGLTVFAISVLALQSYERKHTVLQSDS